MLQQQLKVQDHHLDVLEESLKRLGHMSKGIHEELETQNKMLTTLEQDIEEGQSNLERVTDKINDVVKKSG
jgi:hypothetical protein